MDGKSLRRTARQINAPGPRALVDQDGFLKRHSGRPLSEDAAAIYYLISHLDVPVVHRRATATHYHFLAGDPVELVQVDMAGDVVLSTLGLVTAREQQPRQSVVAEAWQGLRLIKGGKWALLSTTRDQGLSPDKIEIAEARELIRVFARHRALLRAFGRVR